MASAELKKNGYEDADFQQVLEEIEALEAERRSITAEAAGRASGIAKKIADVKKTATKLNIPRPVLAAVLKQRKLEQQLQDVADSVPDEFAEVYEDAAGQFSFLKPADEDEPPAKTAAKKATKTAAATHHAEQEEGQRVLDELGGKPN